MEKELIKLYLKTLIQEEDELLSNEVFMERIVNHILYKVESSNMSLEEFINNVVQERTKNYNPGFEYIRPVLRTIMTLDLENNKILQRHIHILSGYLVYKCIYQKNKEGINELSILLLDKDKHILETREWEFENEINESNMFIILDLINDYILNSDSCVLTEETANLILNLKKDEKDIDDKIEMILKEAEVDFYEEYYNISDN